MRSVGRGQGVWGQTQTRFRRATRRTVAASGLWRPPAKQGPPGIERFAFVAGCSRSGTTSLVRLLNSHPAVAIGMERYKHAFDELWPHQFNVGLFSQQRFFDFRATDTNVTPDSDNRWSRFYERLGQKLEAGVVTVMGDKVPARLGVLETISRNFPECRIIFIFRDLQEVARSYGRRAQDPNDTDWPSWRSAEFAVRDWHRGFRAMDAHIARHGQCHVFVVRYEDLFGDDRPLVKALFSFLSLQPSQSVWDYYAEQQNDARTIRTREGRRQLDVVASTHRHCRTVHRYDQLAQRAKRRWGALQ